MYDEARLKHSVLLAQADPFHHRERLAQLRKLDRLRRSLGRIQAQLGYAVTARAPRSAS